MDQGYSAGRAVAITVQQAQGGRRLLPRRHNPQVLHNTLWFPTICCIKSTQQYQHHLLQLSIPGNPAISHPGLCSCCRRFSSLHSAQPIVWVLQQLRGAECLCQETAYAAELSFFTGCSVIADIVCHSALASGQGERLPTAQARHLPHQLFYQATVAAALSLTSPRIAACCRWPSIMDSTAWWAPHLL